MASMIGGRARGRARGRGVSSHELLDSSSSFSKPGSLYGQITPPATPSLSSPALSGSHSMSPSDIEYQKSLLLSPSPTPPRQPGAPSGRATHRRPRPEGTPQKPGISGGGVADAMSSLSMNEGNKERRKERDMFSEPHTRPTHVVDKQGTSGERIMLKSNYFELQMAPNYMLYQYSVDFAPDIQNKRFRIALLKEHKETLGEVNAFDGMQLFLPQKLPNKVTELFSIRRTDGEKVRLTITLRTEVSPNSHQALQIFNIIFKRVLSLIDCKQIQRHYYAPSLAMEIKKHKLEIWPGYITAIAKYEQKVMLMSDISHKILRSDTVLDTMYEAYQKNKQNYKEELIRQIVGQIVLTRYNNKTYRVDDLDFSQNPMSTFSTTSRKVRPDQSGVDDQQSEITYVDYYKKQHMLPIRDKQQPLLVSRPKKSDIRRGQEGNFYLVPELCTLTGLSDEVVSDFNVMKDLAVHTRVGPDGRVKTLQKFIERINSQENVQQELNGWGLKFSESLILLKGRQLPRETIYQANDSRYTYDPSRADWDRELRGKKLIQCVDLRKWLFLYFARRDENAAQSFMQAILRVGPPMGMHIGLPKSIALNDNTTSTYLHSIKDNMCPDTQLVLCMLPTNKKDLYDSVKRQCCLEQPVPSQCIVTKTVLKKERMMSVATKVALQMNLKMGGQAWATDIPIKNMMICGVDTYHDSQVRGRSVAALVCSLNKAATQYYSKVTFQHTMQELSQGLTVGMVAALKKYHEVNGVLPDRIVVFRDGVGDGQLDVVFDHEMPQLFKSFQQMGRDYNPRIGVIVVKKRINTRLFASGRGTIINPPPGTVVDGEVTRPESYDFFLVSQSVRQGTVTPSHYNVIYDTLGIKPDQYQRLTYKLCHLYFNWPGTIRVPAPCQYAHKLAFLVGQSLHRDPRSELCDKLFFL